MKLIFFKHLISALDIPTIDITDETEVTVEITYQEDNVLFVEGVG